MACGSSRSSTVSHCGVCQPGDRSAISTMTCRGACKSPMLSRRSKQPACCQVQQRTSVGNCLGHGAAGGWRFRLRCCCSAQAISALKLFSQSKSIAPHKLPQGRSHNLRLAGKPAILDQNVQFGRYRIRQLHSNRLHRRLLLQPHRRHGGDLSSFYHSARFAKGLDWPGQRGIVPPPRRRIVPYHRTCRRRWRSCDRFSGSGSERNPSAVRVFNPPSSPRANRESR